MASTRRRLAWKSGQNEKDVENVEIEHAYRISKEERHGPSQKRTIIANFLNFKDKEKVLREYRSSRLWEERLYINKTSVCRHWKQERNSLNKQKS